jgi:hypothetical protein
MLTELRLLYYDLKKKINEIHHKRDLIIQKNGDNLSEEAKEEIRKLDEMIVSIEDHLNQLIQK